MCLKEANNDSVMLGEIDNQHSEGGKGYEFSLSAYLIRHELNGYEDFL